MLLNGDTLTHYLEYFVDLLSVWERTASGQLIVMS